MLTMPKNSFNVYMHYHTDKFIQRMHAFTIRLIHLHTCMIYQSFQQERFPNFFQVMFARAASSRPTNSCRTSGAGSTMISPAIRNHTGSCIRCCGLRACSLDTPSTAKSQKVIKPIISPMVQAVLPMSFLFPLAPHTKSTSELSLQCGGYIISRL